MQSMSANCHRNQWGRCHIHCRRSQIGGRKSVVLMQNSSINQRFLSFSLPPYPFKIPVLGFVSLRG